MKIKLLKGDPTLNAIALIVAGVAGAATGIAVEDMTAFGALSVALAVGIVVGAIAYAVLAALRRRGRG